MTRDDGAATPSPSLARRVGAAVWAATAGLVVGALLAAAIGTVMVVVDPGVEASSPRALLVAVPLMMLQGTLWAFLGGLVFVFPPAVVVLALEPPPTRLAAPGLSIALLASLVLFGYRSRPLDALVLAIPIWVGVRIGLRQSWRHRRRVHHDGLR